MEVIFFQNFKGAVSLASGIAEEKSIVSLVPSSLYMCLHFLVSSFFLSVHSFKHFMGPFDQKTKVFSFWEIVLHYLFDNFLPLFLRFFFSGGQSLEYLLCESQTCNNSLCVLHLFTCIFLTFLLSEYSCFRFCVSVSWVYFPFSSEYGGSCSAH